MRQQQAHNDAAQSMLHEIKDLKQDRKTLQDQVNRLGKLLADLLGEKGLKLCPAGHPLRYEHGSRGFLKIFWCNKCELRCDSISTVRWNCVKCNYDLCTRCSGYKRNVCPYTHALNVKVFGENQKYDKLCDICLKAIKNDYYGCGCGFHMCKKCKEKDVEKQEKLEENEGK